jgi:hypothetical protein
MATKVKTKKRSHEAKALIQSGEVENTTEGQTSKDAQIIDTPQQNETLPALKIDTVYLITHDGLEGYFGPDAQDLVKQIQQQGDDTPYIFYNPKPFYIAIQNGSIEALLFPEPENYGTTSASLFAMAVTCADAIAEFVKLKIRGKVGLLSQLMRPGILGMALVVAIFLIFILAIYLGGK